jgi:hypothetical protein
MASVSSYPRLQGHLELRCFRANKFIGKNYEMVEAPSAMLLEPGVARTGSVTDRIPTHVRRCCYGPNCVEKTIDPRTSDCHFLPPSNRLVLASSFTASLVIDPRLGRDDGHHHATFLKIGAYCPPEARYRALRWPARAQFHYGRR